MPLTRADIQGRKMVNATHINFTRSHSAWLGDVEGVARLRFAKGACKGVTYTEWFIDDTRVSDLDAVLAVLNGEKTLEAAVAELEAKENPPPKKYSIDAQIAEVEREIAMRKKVYGRMGFPNDHFKRQSEADMALEIMGNALETLNWARDNREDVIAWVRAGKQKKSEASAA
jgi:hypothetical protein